MDLTSTTRIERVNGAINDNIHSLGLDIEHSKWEGQVGSLK